MLVLLLSVSAHTERFFEAAEGYMAPALNIENSNFSLAEQRGKYVLVNFWSSADAEARLATKDYDDATREFPEEQFSRVSVNIDSSRRLCNEIIRRDRLNADVQHHADDDQISTIMRDWHLYSGLRSFLIDPSGKIIAVNPSIPTLKKLFGA